MSLALAQRLERHRARVSDLATVRAEGILRRVVGLTLEASGCQMPIGARCRVQSDGGHSVEAEVVGFSGDRTFLMATGDMEGLRPQARVLPLRAAAEVAVGDTLLGRVLDGEGRPLDGGGFPRPQTHVPLGGRPINPLERTPITQVLDVGIRSINGLLSMGRGQRIGLFAGTGVGKSTLLGMMTRHTAADVIVVGLVGERGREVRDFIDNSLGPAALRRACVVVTPADRSPLLRLRGAYLATAIAEYFRDQGRHVLLLMDSLTRFAQAQREIGLAVGEPPATRGYPPSVFARLPQLVERSGNGINGRGSITAVYTVLTESDDPADPIADAARGILDGHIVLSRSLAESGLYPAVDVEASISRVANAVISTEHQRHVRQFRRLLSAYQSHRDLIAIGAYQRGSDPRVDAAMALWPRMEEFLRQDVNEAAGFSSVGAALAALMQGQPA